MNLRAFFSPVQVARDTEDYIHVHALPLWRWFHFPATATANVTSLAGIASCFDTYPFRDKRTETTGSSDDTRAASLLLGRRADVVPNDNFYLIKSQSRVAGCRRVATRSVTDSIGGITYIGYRGSSRRLVKNVYTIRVKNGSQRFDNSWQWDDFPGSSEQFKL